MKRDGQMEVLNGVGGFIFAVLRPNGQKIGYLGQSIAFSIGGRYNTHSRAIFAGQGEAWLIL